MGKRHRPLVQRAGSVDWVSPRRVAEIARATTVHVPPTMNNGARLEQALDAILPHIAELMVYP